MNATKPLLVGECNPYQVAEDPDYALYPYPERSAGGRLCRVILALPPHHYIRAYARANLCSGKWSTPAARERALELSVKNPGVPVVLLGSKVCAAFGFTFEPFTVADRFVRLPHPSGLSRLWNEPGAFERARAVMRDAGALPPPLTSIDGGPTVMKDSVKFLVWCGLTCMGGSEKKQCPCVGPNDCQMRGHPQFEAQRRVATERLFLCAKVEQEKEVVWS